MGPRVADPDRAAVGIAAVVADLDGGVHVERRHGDVGLDQGVGFRAGLRRNVLPGDHADVQHGQTGTRRGRR